MTTATKSPADRFLELWAGVSDLHRASELISWDQETQMPAKGAGGRAQLLSTLAGLHHKALSDPELHDAMAAAGELAGENAELAAQLRMAARDVDRVRKLPEAHARAQAEAQSAGHVAWKAAREANDFSGFAAPLERLVQLARDEARLIAGPEGKPYDALLDLYEPGATEAQLVPLFDELRGKLAQWVQAAQGSGVTVDESPAQGAFDPEAQLAFGRDVAEHMGFDFQAGRIDPAAHPFCSGFGTGDVRLTWRWHDDDFRSALYGIMHEAGHGLYEQGLAAGWQRTPIGGAASLGVHESQSRLWENLVGRSRGFWSWALPRFVEHFPAKRGLTVDELWPTLHTVKPSLIRVEADPGTYDLHIAVRFDIERRLIAGDLEVADLPEAWDAAYEQTLGLRPPDVAQGVLQDIHWSMGAFGYFPTYTLGNLIAAQLFEAAERDLGPLEPAFARGEFAPLLGWLREHVHAHASRYPVSELVQRATGEALSTDAYLRARQATVAAVYGV